MRKRCTTKKIPAKSAAKITYGGKLSEGCVIVNDAGKVKNAGNLNVNVIVYMVQTTILYNTNSLEHGKG